ncbi:MAG TPA: hypothetical protein VGZ48_15425 [Candidatus Acidoferrales bacterium]|jgi:hypothetical protein|nr:hypothetical protein [Candidatus Acidoferrales bacterium]
MRLHALIIPVVLAGIASQGFAQNGAQSGAQAPAHTNSSGSAQTNSKQSGSSSGERLSLTPHYAEGQVIRYQFENTVTSEQHRSGAVSDPQGGGKLTLRWSAIVRMEVLWVGKDAKGQPDGSVRIRSVYEKSAATATSDTYDPAAAGIEAQYAALEGKTIEFAVDAAGHVTDIKGAENAGVQGGADAMRAWVGQFSGGAGAPHGGVTIGETWTVEQPIETAPLAGLVWRIHATYLRNESCLPAKIEGDQNPAAGETCAVILTKLEMTGSRAGHDATPESYKKQGLKTEGTWSGTGDNLSYISLKSGLLVSVTQTSAEQMDFTVSSQTGEDRKVFQGAVQSRTQLALMAPAKQ